MIRALQLLLVLAVALPAASCTALAILRQRSEYRGFLEDWGVNKPKKPWIYP